MTPVDPTGDVPGVATQSNAQPVALRISTPQGPVDCLGDVSHYEAGILRFEGLLYVRAGHDGKRMLWQLPRVAEARR